MTVPAQRPDEPSCACAGIGTPSSRMARTPCWGCATTVTDSGSARQNGFQALIARITDTAPLATGTAPGGIGAAAGGGDTAGGGAAGSGSGSGGSAARGRGAGFATGAGTDWNGSGV